jgi:hypothetical protein
MNKRGENKRKGATCFNRIPEPPDTPLRNLPSNGWLILIQGESDAECRAWERHIGQAAG